MITALIFQDVWCPQNDTSEMHDDAHMKRVVLIDILTVLVSDISVQFQVQGVLGVTAG